MTIIQLYEEKVGMLSPILLDELKRIEVTYPQDWIEDAIDEAVKNGAHSIRYISRILESWKAKGYKARLEKHKETTGAGVMDPSRFKNQKYDHLIRR